MTPFVASSRRKVRKMCFFLEKSVKICADALMQSTNPHPTSDCDRLISSLLTCSIPPLFCWWYNNSCLVPFQWSSSKSKWLTEKPHSSARVTRSIQSAPGTSTAALLECWIKEKDAFSSNERMAFNSGGSKNITHQQLDHRCFSRVEGMRIYNWTWIVLRSLCSFCIWESN